MLRDDGLRFKLCRRKLGTHKIVSTNLAPIIVQHASDSDLVFNARMWTMLLLAITYGCIAANSVVVCMMLLCMWKKHTDTHTEKHPPAHPQSRLRHS